MSSSAEVLPDSARIREVFAAYAACLTCGDVEGIVELFASEAVLEDPIGVAYQGHQRIREFFRESLAGVGGHIRFVAEGPVRIYSPHAACAYTAICEAAEQPFAVDTLDIARFDAQGRLLSMVAIWGSDNVRLLAGE